MLENRQLTQRSKRKPTESFSLERNLDESLQKRHNKSCCSFNGRRSWNTSTVSEQLRAAAVVGVTCGNWRPLVRPDLAWSELGNFSVPGTRGTRGGGIVVLFFSTDCSDRQCPRQDRSCLLSIFEGLCVAVVIVDVLSSEPCVNRCHAILSLVQYTQSPNELVVLLGCGCLVVVVFMPSGQM